MEWEPIEPHKMRRDKARERPTVHAARPRMV